MARLGSLLFSIPLVLFTLVACRPDMDGAKEIGRASLQAANTPAGGTCLQEAAGACSEFSQSGLAFASSSCKTLLRGTYSTGGTCPRANLMATCEKKSGTKYYYLGGSLPWVSDAKAACEKDGEPGKFTAEPNAEETAKAKALPTPGQITGSCTSAYGACEDLHGELAEVHKTTCTRLNGTFSTAPCSSDRLVGSCVKNGSVERYYERDLKLHTVAQLADICEKLATPFGHFYSRNGVAQAPGAPIAEAPKGPAHVGAHGGAHAKKTKHHRRK